MNCRIYANDDKEQTIFYLPIILNGIYGSTTQQPNNALDTAELNVVFVVSHSQSQASLV